MIGYIPQHNGSFPQLIHFVGEKQRKKPSVFKAFKVIPLKRKEKSNDRKKQSHEASSEMMIVSDGGHDRRSWPDNETEIDQV